MKFTKKHINSFLWGILIGAVNALFGAGGGMLTVPKLKKIGKSQKAAQANAISVILPITLISAVLYFCRGNLQISSVFKYIPTGLLGAILGTFCLKKISSIWLKRIFGGFMVYAGIRLIMR